MDSIEKKYYTVVLEVMVPAKMQYRVLAESPEKALEQVKTMAPSQSPHFNYNFIKRISGKVYDMGTMILRYSRNF